MIRKLSGIFLCAFLIPCLSWCQTDGDLLDWSMSRRLNWQDYQATPDPRSGAAASTSSQIGFEYHIRDNNFNYKITCKFSRSKSWVRYKSDYILSHEQGHFDITEIFTRKLVQAIRAFTFNKDSYKTDLRKIYSSVMGERERLQQQYDGETDNSRNKDKQAEWLKKIAALLDSLSAYADYSQPDR